MTPEQVAASASLRAHRAALSLRSATGNNREVLLLGLREAVIVLSEAANRIEVSSSRAGTLRHLLASGFHQDSHRGSSIDFDRDRVTANGVDIVHSTP